MSSGVRPVAGVGIGWRSELAAGLLTNPPLVDFVEVVAERCFVSRPNRREACALSEVWPVIPHGVKLSLGSASGIDLTHARRLGALARELRSPMITEHVAMTRAGSVEVGHLTPIAWNAGMVGVVARNVAAARRCFPDVPFLLENIAWTLRWPDDALAEGAFYHAVCRATGCGLLLDVANVYANALNMGVDPLRALDEYPLDRVELVHVAGGEKTHGFYYDSHARAVPPAVLQMVERVVAARPNVPILLERDAHFPPFAETAAELGAIRAAVLRGRATLRPAPPAPPPVVPEVAPTDMAARQEALARMLTRLTEEPAPFDPAAVARTREVLRRKRIDDALPLLTRLAPAAARVGALAEGHVGSWPRADALVAPADAIRLAELAGADPSLADDARVDALLLRARFVRQQTGRVRPRRSPFIGRVRVGERVIWAIKGVGGGAPLRVFERRG
jgi:uncharacterized protein (UPF0276 family)